MIKKLLNGCYKGNDQYGMLLLALMQGFVFGQPVWIIVAFVAVDVSFNSSGILIIINE